MSFHAYMEVQTPVLDEMLTLKRKPTNIAGSSVVAVYKGDLMVCHVPFNLASSISNLTQALHEEEMKELVKSLVAKRLVWLLD